MLSLAILVRMSSKIVGQRRRPRRRRRRRSGPTRQPRRAGQAGRCLSLTADPKETLVQKGMQAPAGVRGLL